MGIGEACRASIESTWQGEALRGSGTHGDTCSMPDCCACGQVHAPREVNVQEYKGLAFYYDYIHPDGNTGHRVMAELLIALMQRGIADILHTPVTQSERRYIHQPLPPPMMRANHESLSDKCFVGDAFRAKAVLGTPRDWEWVNESQGLRPKWGYVSTQPGSVLEMLVNSTASSGEVDHLVLIQLAYLRSYEHMGKALVRWGQPRIMWFFQ